MSDAHTTPNPGKYYVPHGSPWPIFGSVSLFILTTGAALTLEDSGAGPTLLTVGLVLLFALFFGWFRTVINENQAGLFNDDVDRSFRMGMSWFIFSEVMFFAAFFGALFYARQLSLPWLSGEGAKHLTSELLWNNFESHWPSNGPAHLGPRADAQHRDPAALGRDRHDRAPCAAGRQPHGADDLPRRDLPARLPVRRAAGQRVPRRLHAARPAARHRHLRLDVLHADRLPRPARDDRRDHAARDLAARREGPLHARAALRVRGRVVVLALRRRGVARSVRLRLLALGRETAAARDPRRNRPGWSAPHRPPSRRPPRPSAARARAARSRRPTWRHSRCRGAGCRIPGTSVRAARPPMRYAAPAAG